ncbi:MAG TPA: aliphatic nitrilase, partial [Alcanivorax sp.]|nr:aliphatic nitrilase [Alcanivorax sp.]
MNEAATVRAAAAQIAPDLRTPGGTLDKVCATLEEAAGRGVQLIVFPETLLPYYPYFSFVRAPAFSGADHLALYQQAVTVPG